MAKVNKKEFEKVSSELAGGDDLRFDHIGRVFGQDFWMMLVYAFLDSNDAARAIQGAIKKLRDGETVQTPMVEIN